MRRRVGLLASVVPALALCWSAAVHPQDVTAIAPANAGPEVIPQIEIPTRADADERFAQDVILRAKGRDRTEKLGPRLDALDKSVREQTQLLASDDLKLVPVTRLESLSDIGASSRNNSNSGAAISSRRPGRTRRMPPTSPGAGRSGRRPGSKPRPAP
jgi:hypothetical protein